MSREELTIDKEFEALCPELTQKEREQLRENILADGCRDAIVCWGDIIVDGHNRYRICDEEDKPFKVQRMKFADRGAATNWIIDNQLGRRNISQQARKVLLGKRYNAAKNGQGGDRKSNRQLDGLIATTAETLAEAHDVSPRTVERAGEFAEAVEGIKSKVIGKLLTSGELKATQQQLDALRELPPKLLKAVEGLAKTGDRDLAGMLEAVKPKPEPEPEEPVDELGVVLPPITRADFGRAREFDEIVRDLQGIKKRIETLAKDAVGKFLPVGPVCSDIENAKRQVKHSRPYSVCVYCKSKPGKGCRACKDGGWIMKGLYDAAPEDMK
jgi:hypothetical protein